MPEQQNIFTTTADVHARLEAWLTRKTDSLSRRGLAAIVRRYASMRRRIKPGEKAAVPTLVVGSLMVGGAGKTPIVRHLAMRCRQFGRCAVVCRGWRGRVRDATRVEPSMDAKQVGDEAAWLRHILPSDVVVFASPRLAAGQRLASEIADIILVDDGFQSRSLPRTADIVIGSPNQVSDVMPNGCLREGLSALNNADLYWVHGLSGSAESKTDLEPCVSVRSQYRLDHLRTTAGTDVDLNWLRGRPVVVASALGRNDSFLQTILEAGAQVEHVIQCGDHRAIKKKFLKEVQERPIVITEKDAVKWTHDVPAIVAGVSIEILEGGPRLNAQLHAWCQP